MPSKESLSLYYHTISLAVLLSFWSRLLLVPQKPRLGYMVWIFLMAYILPNKDPVASDLICLIIVIVGLIFLLFFLGGGEGRILVMALHRYS